MPGHISSYTPSDGCVCISLHGEFDVSNADLLTEYLGLVRLCAECRHIEVDLSQVEFLGFAPASVLVDVAAQAWAEGGRLTVTATSRQAQRTLELTGAATAMEHLEVTSLC